MGADQGIALKEAHLYRSIVSWKNIFTMRIGE
jgi:hypothetical protein